MPTSEVYNMDCLEYMKTIPDKHFDLCIADPPYGIGMGTYNRTNKTPQGTRYKANRYHHAEWDSNIPTEELFEELFRVSKERVIWGGKLFSNVVEGRL